MKSAEVTVASASATPLFPFTAGDKAGGPGRPIEVIVANDGGATIEIGGSDLTYGAGVPVPDGESIRVSLTNDQLYGRASTGTVDVRVIAG